MHLPIITIYQFNKHSFQIECIMEMFIFKYDKYYIK